MQNARQYFTGDVISVKEKANGHGPYYGVTVKVAQDILVWFAADSPPDLRTTVEGVGRPNGTSDDGVITFMREVALGPDALDTLVTEEQAPTASAPAPATLPTWVLASKPATGWPEGTYTVVFDGGDYRTIKFDTGDEPGPYLGWTFCRYLDGPDNTSSYRNFAYAKAGQDVLGLKKGYTTDSEIAKAARAVLAATDADRHAMGVAYARQSGNCYVCNRTLTTPESLSRGIGPVCDERVGF